jgi:hypothetical protein
MLGNTIFHNLGGEAIRHTVVVEPTEVVGIAKFIKFDENDRFFTASRGPWVTS